MTELSAKKREKLPAKDFGLPEKARTKDDKKQSGNYPMPDKARPQRKVAGRAATQGRKPHEGRGGADRPQGRSKAQELNGRRSPTPDAHARRRQSSWTRTVMPTIAARVRS